MPLGPYELLFCLIGLIIIPGIVAVSVISRRSDLRWSRRAFEGLQYAAGVALISIALFALLVLLVNVL